MLRDNPYVIGSDDTPFQTVDTQTDKERSIEPHIRMHGEFLQLAKRSQLYIEPVVIKGLGIVMQTETIDVPDITHDPSSKEWQRSFVWKTDSSDTYTCTIDFHALTMKIEKQTPHAHPAVYMARISRFAPHHAEYRDDTLHIDAQMVLDSVSTLVSPFETHNELHQLTMQMKSDILRISDKNASQKERLESVVQLTNDLQKCREYPELSGLITIYMGTQPDTEVNVGYNQSAVIDFIRKMIERYPDRIESPIKNESTHLDRRDPIEPKNQYQYVDLGIVQDYALNSNNSVDDYNLTYVSRCTGMAKSTLSSLRTGNKSIDSLTISTASILTQIGEIYYLKKLIDQADSHTPNKHSNNYWSFDIHTLNGVHTVDYENKKQAHRDRKNVLSILKGGEPRVLDLGTQQSSGRQLSIYLSANQSANTVEPSFYGVSGLYTRKKTP